MEELTVDEAKRMTQIVDQLDELRKSQPLDQDSVEALFEELQDIVEQIDQAFNLHKTGNLVRMIQMLRDENSVIRCHAAEIIATCSQNNPKVQAVAIELGALAYVTHLFVHDEDLNVKVKALLAISCLVRNFTPGESNFASGDGVFVACHGARQSDARIRTKSIFLLNYLLTQDTHLREDAVIDVYVAKMQEIAISQQLVSLIGDEHVDLAEGVLQVILKLLAYPGRSLAPLTEAGLGPATEQRLLHLNSLEGEAKADALTEIDLLTELAKRVNQIEKMKGQYEQM